MKQETQILNWIMTVLSQLSLNESFYFDKRDNKFFSILITDYFMLDENLDVSKNTTTSYSKSNQSKLINRIKRIENEDKYIIPIPRLTNKERKQLLSEYLKSIDDLSEKERIGQLYLSNKELTIFDRKFDIDSNQAIVEGWNSYKNEILLSKAESFLSLNNINIYTASVWEFEKEGSITIDLRRDEKGK